MRRCSILAGVVFLVLVSCTGNEERFRLVPSSESGITFANMLTETVEFNILNYLYFYNGGGVAVGDVNGDGLVDVYFTANQNENKLYLNQGDFKFKDITEEASVAGSRGWSTGVTMADVNSDGLLDIYVSYLGDFLIYKGKNQLFINEGNDENGVPKFKDRSIEFGLDLVGFSTQSSFFDYDRDGDLDMFYLTHSVHKNGTYGKSSLRNGHHPLAGDRLLRNDNGRFVDVTDKAGIYNSVIGYGLGVVVSDVNLDGWPDIYVGNDFHENDYLYINNGDGTFSDKLESQMQHTSRYTMGVDFADVNNDLFPDLVSMDMLSEDPRVQKSAMGEDTYDVYNFKIGYGYNHQFSRNTLQINNQDGTFSDIAMFAGVSATDWSWSTLFADFDLDGEKDIFIANGIQRRFNDLDYINFASADTVRIKIEGADIMSDNELQYISKMPKIKIQNYLYINNGDSTFSNLASKWGLNQLSYSQGSAYADFDNDGDLDLVVNNIEDEAFLYENKTIEKNEPAVNHFVKVKLVGKQGNLFGVGTKVILYAAGKSQLQECMPTRGFQSSVDVGLVFGIGTAVKVDSMLIIWNDGAYQRLKGVSIDQQLTINQENSTGVFNYTQFHNDEPLFLNVTDSVSLPYQHIENQFIEFVREPLIPHMMSEEGPAAAVGDINNDGLDDLFLGGAKWKAGAVYLQTPVGKFEEIKQPVIAKDSVAEDTDALFFDADLDGDNDLIVLSGGNEFTHKSVNRRPRLYLNTGNGMFEKAADIPNVFLTGSCIKATDIDNDGDLDLFLGARSTPWHYGVKPDSYIFINDGKGNFTDQTKALAPQLLNFGFVRGALWADVDNDRDNDLVIAAEWSPITIFINNKGILTPMEIMGSGLENSTGWWSSVSSQDIDGDGDVDFVFGNLGLNSKLKASVNDPIRMYVGDFDKNDSTDQILTHVIQGVEYPFHTRDEIVKQMPYLKKKFLSYHKFADASFKDIFDVKDIKAAELFVAENMSTSLVMNLGNGKFEVKPLPKPAQFSAVNSMLIEDFNRDGYSDVLLAGNFYPVNVQRGRYDASYGQLFLGTGNGKYTPSLNSKSGFKVTGEVRGLKKVSGGNKDYYIAIRNNDSIEIFTLRK